MDQMQCALNKKKIHVCHGHNQRTIRRDMALQGLASIMEH